MDDRIVDPAEFGDVSFELLEEATDEAIADFLEEIENEDADTGIEATDES